MLTGSAFQPAGLVFENAQLHTRRISYTDCSPSVRWRMTAAQNVSCWHWLTEFQSDTSVYGHSGWNVWCSTTWTWFYADWQPVQTGLSSAWRGRSDLSWTPVEQLHSLRLQCVEWQSCQHTVSVVNTGQHERYYIVLLEILHKFFGHSVIPFPNNVCKKMAKSCLEEVIANWTNVYQVSCNVNLWFWTNGVLKVLFQ